jgi:hypothetical protein
MLLVATVARPDRLWLATPGYVASCKARPCNQTVTFGGGKPAANFLSWAPVRPMVSLAACVEFIDAA